MDIKVETVSTFTNNDGKIVLYFGPDYVSISSEESRREGAGPSASGIRFSYGVHPKTCPALWELACAMDGKAYTKEDFPFNPASERIILRRSDYSEEHIVIMALDNGLLQLNLNGTYDHGSKGR